VGRIARLLIAAAVAVPFMGSAAGAAATCACLPVGAKNMVQKADAIIAGRIDNEITLDPTHTRSIVTVQGVYRGNVPSTIYVDSDVGTAGGKSCAVLYAIGTVVDPMVLQRLPTGSYTIEPCTIGALPQLRALLGTARPPPVGGPFPSPDGTPLPIPVGTSTPISGMSWQAVALGLVLAVLLIAAFVRWSGRRAAETTSPFDDVLAEPGSGPEEPDASGRAGPPGHDGSG
jgi:hypothetical protein